ncbi:CcdB family protein [Rhizobium sp. NFR03]|uniref:CcdB family protein n=1 Tax=Rhizobium sp. NFR03 TaxID=1566263 RepID=UPI0008CB1B9E|nr:CcdB family protein [Rhizobium sp. NFR03]SER84480.1 toxin CcdB [Rhizobium sp. NFR03]
MARFRVYELKSSDVIALDLQADLVELLPTRVMAPLYPITTMTWSFSRLNPRFVIDGQTYSMATQRMSSVDQRDIGREVANLSSRSDDITSALDFLFQGF